MAHERSTTSPIMTAAFFIGTHVLVVSTICLYPNRLSEGLAHGELLPVAIPFIAFVITTHLQYAALVRRSPSPIAAAWSGAAAGAAAGAAVTVGSFGDGAGSAGSKLMNVAKVCEPVVWTGQPFCTECNVHVPVRAKHCRHCGRCIARFDHHCMWINGCVGMHNQALFWWFLVTLFALNSWANALLWESIRIDWRASLEANVLRNLLCWISLSITVPSWFMIGMLTVCQSVLAVTNQTQHEFMKSRRLWYMEGTGMGDPSPFDEGVRANLRSFCCAPLDQTDFPHPLEIRERNRNRFNWLNNKYWSCC
eukprot:NODE_2219_length_1260_cov_15.448390_g2020_i0.p1 GENE.NODE_2219_length_1260_cov_15.448390_g2020_i0~~NODE_2219_length_1260_cov_15.448390_g2020_i0.p1  ORF type:complete len:308 (-),score=34.56 NODE_2219_length_1260_cov_15.448390_g2020_i0:233-1156(-)